MNWKWDNKIGLASVVGLFGSLSVLAAVAAAWGSMTTKIDVAAQKAEESRLAVVEVSKTTAHRDERVSQQAERLGKIETSISFIVPALQRIEAKLDTSK